MDTTEIKKSIGKTLHHERDKYKLTKKQMATMLHVSVSTYSKWEKCQSLPRVKYLISIAKTFHIMVETLLYNN